MTDENIHRIALVVLIGACAGSWALAARFSSIPWAVVAAWLSFAIAVETWPPRRGA